jgi:hypothetical protein
VLVASARGLSAPVVDLYYDHSFREFFMTGRGPLEIHRAAMSILTGNVFPRPSFALR